MWGPGRSRRICQRPANASETRNVPDDSFLGRVFVLGRQISRWRSSNGAGLTLEKNCTMRKEMHKMYDLYLSLGCRTLPDLEALTPKVPMLADLALHTRILKRSPGPGFLGLDLPDTLAVSLLRRLKSAKASGCRLPSAYRQPL